LGLLGFFQGSPLKKLEAEAERDPSPETLAALAQHHVDLGRMDLALLVAEKGLQTFRGSVRLRELHTFIRKKQSQERVKHLRDEIRVKPSPTAYTQLAGIYRDLGDIDQALDLLGECTERFADDQVAYRMVGLIRLDNFLQDVIAYDGLHALAALRRVGEVGGGDSAARIAHAQLLYAVGANELAARELGAELAANPTALDVKGFLEDLGAPAPLAQGTTVESLIERCEETGTLVNSLQGFPRVKPGILQRTTTPTRINAVAAQGKVQELQGTPGLLNLVILDREGRGIASLATPEGLDQDPFRELAGAIQSEANEACRRMDIGTFVRGAVAFPKGGACFVRRRGTTFALLHADPMKGDRAAAFLEEFVVRIVGGGPGA
jgi:tetratricopeptide (TPR) repeat protein